MLRLVVLIGLVAVLALVGGAVYVASSDSPPPQQMVEKIIPDSRLPR
jgi:hypothetical protein